ncbi:MAG: methylated-DNA--[protein]-cysteine S-methyltransferase [Acetobacter sp.]|nr:methylated-DNA--[protein]-cysteine S-methyltransferase [Bacteroides sp.]MCM1341099.1 methylated-DNA--[protein]-cysteine S-methyltransferase [Acetobacter sp.]MCM1433568.1 methylated-DNA--[protein]-cysteine S-methyltransferase [Clostridiales bacterium]
MKTNYSKFISYYNSPLGKITLASDGDNLTGLWFENQKYFGSNLADDCEYKKLPLFKQTEEWLDIYFSGKNPDFSLPILLKTTPFRQTVYEILLTIPFGKTMTYGEIAGIIANQKGIQKMSARAVGSAVGHNPVSIIIPCHRVVGKNGAVTGYAGGIDRKYKLLTLEKSSCKNLN